MDSQKGAKFRLYDFLDVNIKQLLNIISVNRDFSNKSILDCQNLWDWNIKGMNRLNKRKEVIYGI